MPCLICGETPTVKSHILPKGIIQDVRDDAPHVTGASPDRPGARASPGGRFATGILCRDHENATSLADKHGIEFVRAVNRLNPTDDMHVLWVPNANPAMLMRFAAGVVWREVHSEDGKQQGHSLGPYEARFRNVVFDGGGDDFPTLAVYERYRVGDQRAKFAVHPFRAKLGDVNAWRFVAASVSFVIVADKRRVPVLEEFWADRRNPCPVLIGDDGPIVRVPVLRPLLESMMKPSSKRS